MKFELEINNIGISDGALLDDLRACARSLGKNTITTSEYDSIGKAHSGTIMRRFRYWHIALEKAGLDIGRSQRVISEEELFQNLKDVWISLQRQPRRREMDTDISKFSESTYRKRFGTWTQALNTFVKWVNSEEITSNAKTNSTAITNHSQISERKRTNRQVTERQRFRVLVRDGFRCLSCGASPIITPGVQLEVDHIIPWTKGGETIDDNLETKCKRCNRAKGNAFSA